MIPKRQNWWLQTLAWTMIFNLSFAASIDQNRPNIVFIFTDDQDLHMDSLSYMPFLQKHLVNEGTTFQRHYCTISLCCPSRASLWTGLFSHNTNVTDIAPPFGKYQVQQYEPNYQCTLAHRASSLLTMV